MSRHKKTFKKYLTLRYNHLLSNITKKLWINNKIAVQV